MFTFTSYDCNFFLKTSYKCFCCCNLELGNKEFKITIRVLFIKCVRCMAVLVIVYNKKTKLAGVLKKLSKALIIWNGLARLSELKHNLQSSIA